MPEYRVTVYGTANISMSTTVTVRARSEEAARKAVARMDDEELGWDPDLASLADAEVQMDEDSITARKVES